jgi:hypothetical protein
MRRLRHLTLLLCLLAISAQSPAQQPIQKPSLPVQLPSASSPQLLAGKIAGTIIDSNGGSIAEARIALPRSDQPPVEIRVFITSPDGRFLFSNVTPGPFSLAISATNFMDQQVSGDLHAGESIELPAIELRSTSTLSAQVTASLTDIADAQVSQEEKQRVLAFIPNFYVSYDSNPVPLDPAQKFNLALRTLVDPVSLILNGALAGIEQTENTYAWGQGAQSYAKLYAAGYGNMLTDTLLGNAVLPILFKQDPRYFYKGTGSIHSRAFYAIANAVICKGDNRRWQPNYSGILGGLASSGLSNLYYPAVNRDGASLTFENAALGTGFTAIANLFQEFVVRKLTPHLH